MLEKKKKKRKNKLEEIKDEDKDVRVGFYLDDEFEKIVKKKRNVFDVEEIADLFVDDKECVKKLKKSKKKKKERKVIEDEFCLEEMAEIVDSFCVKESDKI